MKSELDIAYIAGLFDGEGSIYYARRPEKKKKHKGKGYRISNSLRMSMEITMTDQSVIRWVHEILGCGTVSNWLSNISRYSLPNSLKLAFSLSGTVIVPPI